jgi:hypothetical protein
MMQKHRILSMILIIVGLPLITYGLMSFSFVGQADLAA